MKTILSLLLISSSLLLANDCYFFVFDGKPKPSSMTIKDDHLNMAMRIKKIELPKAKSIIAFHQGLGDGRTFQIQINLTEDPAKGIFPMLKVGDDIFIEHVTISREGLSSISIEGDNPELIKKWVELLRLHFKLPKDKVSIHLEPEPAEPIAAPQLAISEDMQSYLSKTTELAGQGKHEEALKRHIWFHNHALEHEPAMYGVRLSFALSYWKGLADKYPPALKALKAIRDEADKSLREGSTSKGLFHDLLAINRTLKESKKTMDLFEFLDSNSPEMAKKCFKVADDLILESGETDLYVKYAGDLKADLRRAIQMYKETIDHMSALAKESEPDESIKFFTKRIKKKGSDLSAIAMKLGHEELSKELQSMTDEATR